EREREQEDDDQPERQHLVQRHARAGLDAQVLARDEHRLPPEVHPARTSSSSSVAASRAGELGGSATPKCATPPARTPSRPAGAPCAVSPTRSRTASDAAASLPVARAAKRRFSRTVRSS